MSNAITRFNAQFIAHVLVAIWENFRCIFNASRFLVLLIQEEKILKINPPNNKLYLNKRCVGVLEAICNQLLAILVINSDMI